MQDPEGDRFVSPSRDGDLSFQDPGGRRSSQAVEGGSACLKCVCVAVCIGMCVTVGDLTRDTAKNPPGRVR